MLSIMKFNWRIVTGLNRHRSVLPGLAFILCLSAPHLRAQGYGSISGTVTDSDGAAVPNSTVTATLVETGRQINATSNAQGNYVLNSLQPSHYTIRVTATGFQTYQQNDVLLEANQTLTVDAHLAVGQATQTVEVTSAVPQVDTTSGTMAQVIDRDRVVDLPLNGRNAASLMTLVAGVGDATNAGNGTDQGKGKTFPAAVVITANGTQPSQSNYLLDGGNNLDELTNVNAPFPFPDALQEFSIQTSNYSAEFGQSAGAVVNIITKAGTNKFHGALFEFLRNGYFNARPYFATVADNLHRNQFGGTVGGRSSSPISPPGRLHNSSSDISVRSSVRIQMPIRRCCPPSPKRGATPMATLYPTPISAISVPAASTRPPDCVIPPVRLSAIPSPTLRIRTTASLQTPLTRPLLSPEGLPYLLRGGTGGHNRRQRQLLQAHHSELQ